MAFANWPPWKKTGLIFLIIYILAVIGIIIYANLCHELYCGFVILVILIPSYFIVDNLSIPNASFYVPIICIVFNMVLSFLLGAIVGQLYSKFKSKKRK